MALVGGCLLGTSAPAAAVGKTAFRPYVDLSGYPPPDLVKMSRGSGARQISLGFVTARNGTECVPTWGGYPSYPASGASPYRLANIGELRRAGGEPIASFGGQAGTELASACGSARALEAAYSKVISAYGLMRIDFDIEGAAVADRAANARRASAAAALQQAAHERGDTLAVGLTLPVNPDGLDGDGRAVVRGFENAGVDVDVVNVMAMDYGNAVAPQPAGRMGAYAIAAARHTARQFRAIVPALGAAAAPRMVGVTPMIGINDVSSEIFTLADARKLVRFAKRFGLGELSMWQLARDVRCKHPSSTTQEHCSGVDQKPWQFSRILG